MTKLRNRTLCRLKKDDVLKDEFVLFATLVRSPTHLCRRCGRAANDQRRLCKPVSLSELDPKSE